ncbi:4Fe-4S dicluster domain-containing protein [Desulfocurvibacter africanus]|jgi:2-oxoglutarate ferredoxin oxidoreductase subunit delta|uniref:4Fe-4S ferredoxin iron-sulfur binding domain-containing protein n=2 Tax=Desulfocurvibacter africanus TaxID=873 RepID=F3YX40_DESAF|nr:4Fe-4S dicluster domain-containing protein [Desulfocurvibacter africanus]EGJ49428.1 4Fe-4S ferredoxin iron-sulfur binding domain-containing protein [Desulfocurvibacter africanus subsp. africanus str. Walvis Bay]EMG38491.1 2-oxoglutarate ferredoxin oxidoreductase, delta subunit [Desulfocurvibacter africanus PCS]
MSRIAIQEERCKGCLLCTLVCPKKIIVQSERINRFGYKVAEVREGDMDKCTGCASCAMICPDYAIEVWKTVKAKAEAEEVQE